MSQHRKAKTFLVANSPGLFLGSLFFSIAKCCITLFIFIVGNDCVFQCLEEPVPILLHS